MYDVIIIGSGPAGLMAAIEASKQNKVLVIEKNIISGKKLLLSGGGRCNLTNLRNTQDFLEEVDYHKKYLYSAITAFGPSDICQFFSSRGVPLKEEEDKKIFPKSNKSYDILNVLLQESQSAEFKYNETVLSIEIQENVKKIKTDKGSYDTKNVIIATGGVSFKNTGSSGDHLKFATMLNQPITPIFPAEVGVILQENLDLAGTSIQEVIVKHKNHETSGNLLYTHNGLSGSAIMKISEHIYNSYDKEISIDLLPGKTNDELFNYIDSFGKEKEIITLLNALFTKRFSNYLVNKQSDITNSTKIKTLNRNQKDQLVKLIKDCKYIVKETGNIEGAYVTGGGISLKEINTTTMESKINKGVYFIGESLDIHGPIGGYNITLALSTGFLAGSNISK